MTAREFPLLAQVKIDLPPSWENASVGAHLADCLRMHDPAVASSAATSLYATFLALLARLVGEALTLQLLRMADPAIQLAEETE